MDRWKLTRLVMCLIVMLGLMAAGLIARTSLEIPVIERFHRTDWVTEYGSRPFPRRLDVFAELRDQIREPRSGLEAYFRRSLLTPSRSDFGFRQPLD
jgi:hypothetical protein